MNELIRENEALLSAIREASKAYIAEGNEKPVGKIPQLAAAAALYVEF